MSQEQATKAPVKTAEPRVDDVEKFLTEQLALEAHRQELIQELLREKEAAIKAIDEKLAKLGYHNGDQPKRSPRKPPEEKKA